MSLIPIWWFKKTLNTVPRLKLWQRLQWLGIPFHSQQVVKAMYTTVYAKIRPNIDTHGEVMSDIDFKQGHPFPTHYPTCALMNLKHIYLDKFNMDSMCLFNTRLPFFFILMMLFCSLIMSTATKTYQQTTWDLTFF